MPEENQEFGKVDIQKSMIFVHPAPNAPSIAEWFGTIKPHIGAYVPEELVEYEELNQMWQKHRTARSQPAQGTRGQGPGMSVMTVALPERPQQTDGLQEDWVATLVFKI